MTGGARVGRLLVDGALVPGRVAFSGGRIERVEPLGRGEAPDGPLPIVAPGLVDLHVHGFGGAEPREDLAAMATALAAAGTTAFLPTLFPRRDPTALGRDAARVAAAAAALPAGAARALGTHLEGPFVSPTAAGGLPRDELAEPSPAALRALLGPATGDARGVRAVTVAPELPGAPDLVAELARLGIRASLGHSRASAAEARAAIARGATGATHLFNAMGPLHHREAGLANVALVADELVCEVIGDLAHVGPEALALALRARGPEGLCLVSDALVAAGTGAARFRSHGCACVAADGAAWVEAEDGTRRLTGSLTGQLDAVRRLVREGVLGPADALRMASETPARALGLEDELGRLVPGARADLLVLGDDLAPREVLVGGVAAGPAPPAPARSGR